MLGQIRQIRHTDVENGCARACGTSLDLQNPFTVYLWKFILLPRRRAILDQRIPGCFYSHCWVL